MEDAKKSYDGNKERISGLCQDTDAMKDRITTSLRTSTTSSADNNEDNKDDFVFNYVAPTATLRRRRRRAGRF